ncbi:hypothetical protein BGW38_005650, partial [Lunasporangiospora selenospora]
VSRRLRTRLEYAILKIRKGWSKYTLHEVESLSCPPCSPRVSARLPRSSASPRPGETRQNKRPYPYLDESAARKHLRAMKEDQGNSTPIFCDSELYQPAKSLMEIATSKPEPGYASPSHRSQPSSPMLAYHHPQFQSPDQTQQRFVSPEPRRETTPARDPSSALNPGAGRWSSHSTPTTPVMSSRSTFDDEQDETGVPSAAQAARTILMLSSPTRPTPRTLNQNYIVEMSSGSPTAMPLGEWNAPYSPITSSPLVHFQTTASSSLLSDQPFTMVASSEGDRAIPATRQRGASPHPLSGRPPKQTLSSPYGTGHEPSSPSPLSQLPTSVSDPLDRVRGHSRSSSPTLKRAVRFTTTPATAVVSSGPHSAPSSPVEVGRNDTSEYIYPGQQQGVDDRKESAQLFHPSAHVDPYSGQYNGLVMEGVQLQGRALTPPLASLTQSSFALLSPEPPQFGAGSHGMRTPPPSGGKDVGYEYIATTMDSRSYPIRRRRGSLPEGTTTDLAAMYRSGQISSASAGPARGQH